MESATLKRAKLLSISMARLPYQLMKIVSRERANLELKVIFRISEMAAWLASYGPISIGINAAAMQVYFDLYCCV